MIYASFSLGVAYLIHLAPRNYFFLFCGRNLCTKLFNNSFDKLHNFKHQNSFQYYTRIMNTNYHNTKTIACQQLNYYKQLQNNCHKVRTQPIKETIITGALSTLLYQKPLTDRQAQQNIERPATITFQRPQLSSSPSDSHTNRITMHLPSF